MITFLNQNSGAIQGIAVVVLVVLTAWYARETRRLARSAEAALLIERMPVVLGHMVHGAIHDELEQQPARVRLLNSSRMPALNITVDIYQPQDGRIGGTSGPIAFFGGDQKDWLDVGEFQLRSDTPYEVVIEYFDVTGNGYRTRRSSLLNRQSSVTLEVRDFVTGERRTLVDGITIVQLPPVGN